MRSFVRTVESDPGAYCAWDSSGPSSVSFSSSPTKTPPASPAFVQGQGQRLRRKSTSPRLGDGACAFWAQDEASNRGACGFLVRSPGTQGCYFWLPSTIPVCDCVRKCIVLCGGHDCRDMARRSKIGIRYMGCQVDEMNGVVFADSQWWREPPITYDEWLAPRVVPTLEAYYELA